SARFLYSDRERFFQLLSNRETVEVTGRVLSRMGSTHSPHSPPADYWQLRGPIKTNVCHTPETRRHAQISWGTVAGFRIKPNRGPAWNFTSTDNRLFVQVDRIRKHCGSVGSEGDRGMAGQESMCAVIYVTPSPASFWH